MGWQQKLQRCQQQAQHLLVRLWQTETKRFRGFKVRSSNQTNLPLSSGQQQAQHLFVGLHGPT